MTRSARCLLKKRAKPYWPPIVINLEETSQYCNTEPDSICFQAMDGQASRARDPYLVKSVVHSSQLLRAFRTAGEVLPLREISKRSALPKSMVFRLLYALEKCGMVQKVGENLYQSCVRPFKCPELRFAANQERWTERDMLRPRDRPIERAKILHALANSDHSIFQFDAPLESYARQREMCARGQSIGRLDRILDQRCLAVRREPGGLLLR